MRLLDQFQGGIDPVQDHSAHSSDTMETRLVRYACRISGLDELGNPVIEDGSAGDINCGLHWPAGNRPIGGWASIWATTGGSRVKATGASSSANDAANQAAVSGGAQGGAADPGVMKDAKGVVIRKQIGNTWFVLDKFSGVWRSEGVAGSGKAGYRNVGMPPFGLTTGGNGGANFVWDAKDREGYNTGLYEIGGRGFYLSSKFYVGRFGGVIGGNIKSGMGGAAGPAGSAGVAGNAGAVVQAATSSSHQPPVITSETMPSTAIGVDLYPVLDSSGRADTSFAPGGAALPAGWPSIVHGSRGAVLSGTEHTGQYPVYLHTDPRMVAVNAGPDPDAGSVVYDTDNQGQYDPGRFGRLQSLIRVMPPFTGSLDFGKGGTLAHQHARGERDGVAGYGAYVDLSSAAAGSAAPVTTPTGSSSPSNPVTTPSGSAPALAWNGQIASLSAAMTGYMMQAVYASQQKAASAAASKITVKGPNDGGGANVRTDKRLNEPILTVGLQSARVGGPIEPGHGKKDKHRVGQSGDSAVNVGHLATFAPWYADSVRDGPLDFEKAWYPYDVSQFPLKSHVHLQFSPGHPNGGNNAFGPHIGPSLPGAWRLWAEVPQLKEGGYPPPPPTNPPPRTKEPDDPPTREPPPTTPTEPSDPPIIDWGLLSRRTLLGGLIGGAGWNRDGSTSRDDLMLFKGAGLGSPMGVQVRNPDRSRAPRRGIGIGPVDLPRSALPAEPPVKVSSMLPMGQRKTIGVRADTVTSYPGTVSYTSVLFRPVDLRSTQPDIRSSTDIDGDKLRSMMRSLPYVLRMEPWGAFNGTRFTPSSGFGASRYDSPTGAGGLLMLPPDLDMKDVEAGSSPLPSTSAYLMAYPGTCFAAGVPVMSTGTMKTGYKWCADATGSLGFDGVDSSGTVTANIFGGTATQRFFFRESGGTKLVVGAFADGDWAVRSGGTFIGRSPATGWGTPTGILSRAAFDASTVTATVAYEVLAALVTDLKTKGIIAA